MTAPPPRAARREEIEKRRIVNGVESGGGNGGQANRRHHQRRHRAHGHDAAHGPSAGHRRGGRAEAQERRSADPGADAGRARCQAHGGAGGGARQPALDDESRRGAGRPGQDLHGLLRHRRAARARAQGDRGGQAHPYREADRADRRGGDGAGAARRQGRRQARRHPGQALPARLRQAAVREELGLLRPHPVGEGRCRLVDLRRHDAGMPAAELELPQARRRRAGARYDGALALHDRPAGGADHRRQRADEHGHARAGRRSRASATRSMPRTPTTPCCRCRAARSA